MSCDSTPYYFGIYNEIDYEKARYCALSNFKFDHPDDGLSSFNFDSSTDILLSLYANGFGTKQNLDLATKLACDQRTGEDIDDDKGALIDYIYTIVNLFQSMKHEKMISGKEFDFYKNTREKERMAANSTYINYEIEYNKRIQNLNLTVLKNWKKLEKEKLYKLMKISDEYVYNEVSFILDLFSDRYGTASGVAGITTDLNRTLQHIFYNNINRFERAEIPQAIKSKDLKNIDKNLNQLYKKIMSISNIESTSDVQYTVQYKKDLKKSELSWIKYKDAWSELFKIKYKNLNFEDCNKWIMQERVNYFQNFLDTVLNSCALDDGSYNCGDDSFDVDPSDLFSVWL